MVLPIIGIAFVAIIAFALYNASKLQSIQIVKSVTINAPREEVFKMVQYLSNFPKWSPFLAQDPSQKYTVKGTDGTVGAQYHWEGNKGNDLGYQEIAKIDSLNSIVLKCSIQKPFEASPSFEYTFKEVQNGIVVTQDFKLQSNLVNAFFMWMLGVKPKMEETNVFGLDLLKKAVENKK